MGGTFTDTEVFVERRAQGGESIKYLIDLQYVTLDVLLVMLGVRRGRSPSESPLDFTHGSGLIGKQTGQRPVEIPFRILQ